MEIIGNLIKGLIHGGIGIVVGLAFAEAFSWNVWLLGCIGYLLGWLLLSKGFWEGAKEGLEELKEDEKREKESANKNHTNK